MPTPKKPVDVAVFNSRCGKWNHRNYFRAEVRIILGKGGKPMPEATLKTRLAFLWIYASFTSAEVIALFYYTSSRSKVSEDYRY